MIILSPAKTMKLNEENVGNEFDWIMEEYEIYQEFLKENLEQSNCGTLLYNMKNPHIIPDTFVAKFGSNQQRR